MQDCMMPRQKKKKKEGTIEKGFEIVLACEILFVRRV